MPEDSSREHLVRTASSEHIGGTVSPTNYPDIIEDTQSADSREFESPETSPEHRYKGPDKGTDGENKNRESSGDRVVVEGEHSHNDGYEEVYIRNNGTERVLILDMKDKHIDTNVDTNDKDSGVQSIEVPSSSQSVQDETQQSDISGASQVQSPGVSYVHVQVAGAQHNEAVQGDNMSKGKLGSLLCSVKSI